MEKLEITIAGDSWAVIDNNPRVFELFNTNTIPTPYMLSYPLDQVIAKIRSLNPDKEVTLSRPVHLYARGVITLNEAIKINQEITL